MNVFALILVVLIFLILFYGAIIVHDIPYEIAKKRNHPHQDAIHVAGWVSLFTLHVIWPFLWIWSMLYHPEKKWGMSQDDTMSQQLQSLQARIEKLESKSVSKGGK